MCLTLKKTDYDVQLNNYNLTIKSSLSHGLKHRRGCKREGKMADNTNDKLLTRDTAVAEPVIDKHSQLIETRKAEEIIESAMIPAR